MDNGRRQHPDDVRHRKPDVMPVLILLCTLGGCDRPGAPPLPVDPARPKMFQQEQAIGLGPAIFHYVLPSGSHPATQGGAPPVAGRRLQV